MRVVIGCLALLSGVTGCTWRAGDPAKEGIAAKEVFLLSPGLRGPVLIVYGQQHGMRATWRGDTAIYAVPADGTLHVAGQEPGPSTKVEVRFRDRPSVLLRDYPSCTEMHSVGADVQDDVAVCWFDYRISGSGILEHLLGVITSGREIKSRFDSAAAVYETFLGRHVRDRPVPRIPRWER